MIRIPALQPVIQTIHPITARITRITFRTCPAPQVVTPTDRNTRGTNRPLDIAQIPTSEPMIRTTIPIRSVIGEIPVKRVQQEK